MHAYGNQPWSQFQHGIRETQRGTTLQLKLRGGGGGWLDSLGSEILVGKDILEFFKNTDLDNS